MADESSPSGTNFYRTLDRLPIAAYVCDPSGLIEYFNRAAQQLWGRAPALNDPTDRFCGSFKLFALDGSPISHDQCWMALALKTGNEVNRQEIVIERPDGSRSNVLAHATPLRDATGKLVGAVNILVDISEQTRADEDSVLLASIVANSDDAIVSKTLEGQILTWNHGAENIFGFTAEEAIGRPITLIIPPDRFDEEKMILSRLRRGERIEHYETVRLSKTGRRIDISLTVSPIRDSAGRIVAASKVARDITVRKEFEANLKRLNEMIARLAATRELKVILADVLWTAVAINGTDMGFVSLWDPERRQTHVAAQLGLSDAFLNALEYLPPSATVSGTCFQKRRTIVVEDLETDPTYVTFRSPTRRAGIRAVHSTPLVTRTGEVLGVLTTYFRQPHRPSDPQLQLIDVCTRQAADAIENSRLYEQLQEADRRKDEFLATLAHELRNPLAPISNSLNLLRLTDDLSPAVQRVREIMEQQVAHIVRLVDDLLEVSRVTRGKIELRLEPVELSTIIASAVEISRPAIEAAGHQLAITISPDPITLNADSVRLSQVVANLLNNAAKYMNREGQIWLTAGRDTNEAVISVRDTGFGIATEMLPRIFEMFAQMDQTLSHAQGGLGIGLTLAKRLVEMHGGTIEALSDGSGRGSEFIVRVPTAISALSPSSIISHQPAIISLPHHKILVVDDTPSAVYVLGKLLEKMGQTVRTADSATSAMAAVRTDPPDIVISDIGMPNMSGYELAKQLRREPGLDAIVLVALTGYGQASDRAKSKEAGFDYHLVKPVSMEALQELLASLQSSSDTYRVASR